MTPCWGNTILFRSSRQIPHPWSLTLLLLEAVLTDKASFMGPQPQGVHGLRNSREKMDAVW